MFRTVTIDIVMGPNGFLKLVADDHARALCARTTREYHDSRTSVGVSGLVDQILVRKELQLL